MSALHYGRLVGTIDLERRAADHDLVFETLAADPARSRIQQVVNYNVQIAIAGESFLEILRDLSRETINDVWRYGLGQCRLRIESDQLGHETPTRARKLFACLDVN